MLITGAGGFAKQLLDVCAQLNLTKNLVFFDNINPDASSYLCKHFPVLHSLAAAQEYFHTRTNHFVLGVGQPKARYKLYQLMSNIGGKPYTLVSPLARIATYDCHLSNGVCVLTYSIVESSVSIGRGTLINLHCSVTHDSYIGEFCELSPGVRISGGCKVGNFCRIGTNAVLLPNIQLGNNVVVGAGAVVTRNVADNQTVVGVPARSI